MISHAFKKHKGVYQIVVVILKRFRHRFAHRLKPREMYDGVDFVLLKDFVHGRAVANVVFIKFYGFSGYLFHPRKGFFAGIVQIVHNNNVISRLLKGNAGVAADKSGAAGNENGCHKVSSYLSDE